MMRVARCGRSSSPDWRSISLVVLLVSACGTRISLGTIPSTDASAEVALVADAGSSDDSSLLSDGDGSVDGGLGGNEDAPIPDAGPDANGDDAGPDANGSDAAFDVDSRGAAGDGAAPDSGPASTINGSADGMRPFTNVSAAWWIQYPDPRVDGGPVVSTVVYLFAKPVACGKLSAAKWDENAEPGDTQDLEIEMAWSGASAPMAPPAFDYPVTAQARGSVPPPGLAVVSYHLTPMQPPGAPSELIASGGTVELTSLSASTRVSGAFNVTFSGGGSVVGTFDAAYCQDGREP